MPTIESFQKMEEITPEWLIDGLKRDTVLILDCRSQKDFQDGHIANAMNVNLPPLLMRRLKKGNMAASSAIQDNSMKDKFTSECNYKDIVMYECMACDVNANNSTLLSMLYEKLMKELCRVKVLSGGYDEFSTLYPEYVERSEVVDDRQVTIGLSTLSLVEEPSPKSGDITPSPAFPIEVVKNLYLGNAKCSMDSEALLQNNIRYILNVTPNLPNHFEGSSDVNITYKQIPITDHWSQNLSAYFPEAIAFIDEGRSKGYGVLVHCLAGISRSVTITVAYLMRQEKMSLNDAYDFVKRAKPNISPNFNFMGQLLDFEQTLKPKKNDSNVTACTCKTLEDCQCGTTKSNQMFFMTPTSSAPNYELQPLNVR